MVKGITISRSQKALAFHRSSLFASIKLSSVDFNGDFYRCISPLKLHLRSPALFSFQAQHKTLLSTTSSDPCNLQSLPQAKDKQQLH